MASPTPAFHFIFIGDLTTSPLVSDVLPFPPPSPTSPFPAVIYIAAAPPLFMTISGEVDPAFAFAYSTAAMAMAGQINPRSAST